MNFVRSIRKAGIALVVAALSGCANTGAPILPPIDWRAVENRAVTDFAKELGRSAARGVSTAIGAARP